MRQSTVISAGKVSALSQLALWRAARSPQLTLSARNIPGKRQEVSSLDGRAPWRRRGEERREGGCWEVEDVLCPCVRPVLKDANAGSRVTCSSCLRVGASVSKKAWRLMLSLLDASIP